MMEDEVFASSKIDLNNECGDTRQRKGGTLKTLAVEYHSYL
jgi:hypothetical protein